MLSLLRPTITDPTLPTSSSTSPFLLEGLSVLIPTYPSNISNQRLQPAIVLVQMGPVLHLRDTSIKEVTYNHVGKNPFPQITTQATAQLQCRQHSCACQQCNLELNPLGHREPPLEGNNLASHSETTEAFSKRPPWPRYLPRNNLHENISKTIRRAAPARPYA